MNRGTKVGFKSKAARQNDKQKKRDESLKEIAHLKKRIQSEAPPAGHNPVQFVDESVDAAIERVLIDGNESTKIRDKREEKHNTTTTKQQQPQNESNAAGGFKLSASLANVTKFSQLALSSRMQKGLSEAGFVEMTRIQRGALPHALAGRDVLGSARTGSGKTLAYVIPVLEKLYIHDWNPQGSGLGALIIAPTRELAVQIFDVLRTVGKYHDFAAGLVIGGKDLKTEQKLIGMMNILVATPGRLLQHMDQSYLLDCTNLRVLVLDETDRILDMGFQDTIDAVLENVPPSPQRQTLLFSATQTKEVQALARLSLSDPEYIAVDQHIDTATPPSLVQHYMICEAGQKLDILYSFIRTHLKNKTIVFMSVCKQVRLVFELFRRLRPGIPLMHIHGSMSQARRMEIYYEYCNKGRAVLFATDIASRGLDFPNVDWVVQLDCPDRVETYIHRAGRTARYQSSGNALLFLLQSEIAMLDKLKERKITMKQVRPNTEKLQTVVPQFQAILAEEADLKYLAQKAFIGYVRSIHLAEDKDVFDVNQLDTAGLASSYGLIGMPSIKKLKGSRVTEKNMPYELREMLREEKERKKKEKLKKKALNEGEEKGDGIGETEEEIVKEKEERRIDKRTGKKVKKSMMEKLLSRKNESVEMRRKLVKGDDDSDGEDGSEDEFITIKKKYTESSDDNNDEEEDVRETIKQQKRRKDRREDEVDEKAKQWAREQGLRDSDSEDDDASDDDEDETLRKEKEKRKAEKKAKRKKEIEERLRKAMLANDVKLVSLHEAIEAGLDEGFVKELREMVKREDPKDKAREHERVKAKHRKMKELMKGLVKKEGNGEQVQYVLGGDSDEEDNDDHSMNDEESENESGFDDDSDEDAYSYSTSSDDDDGDDGAAYSDAGYEESEEMDEEEDVPSKKRKINQGHMIKQKSGKNEKGSSSSIHKGSSSHGKKPEESKVGKKRKHVEISLAEDSDDG